MTTLFTDPRNFESAVAQSDPVITLLFAAAGIVVWQLGKTYALFVTLPRAAGRAAGRQLETTKIASEVRDGLDDRLSDLEDDLAETKRAVRALEAEGDHTATFDETDRLEGETDRPSELESAAVETNPPPSSPSDGSGTESTDDGPANDRSATEFDDDEPADGPGDDADDPLA
ncbi:hypothetical protein A6E15_12370 [Natrinema saccharevitans]|uniref:Uncharacterized protein n=1 Tax=Natrinema saccharevitans TaxID=301967 RepID=A0A1S8B1M6_9EURY|nr:hypothetical protein A6E15_12370 [Natrinema saccharevitans]